jgi:hypothetical protein
MTDYEEIIQRLHRIEGMLAQLLEGKAAPAPSAPTPEIPAPPCNKCGGETAKRTSARGPFFGCKKYPNCKGIVNWDDAVKMAAAAPTTPVPPPAEPAPVEEMTFPDIPF